MSQGDQNEGHTYIVEGMEDGDAQGGGSGIQECPVDKQTDAIENHSKEHRAEGLIQQMQGGSPAGIPVGAHSAQHSGNAGADVLTQDNGDSRTHRNGTGQRQALEDTHGGGGRLNDGSQHRAEQDTQDGVREGDHQFAEPSLVLQKCHGVAHNFHTGHQCHEAQQNGANALLLLTLGEHKQGDTNDTQDGGKGGRLKHLDNKAFALQTGQGQDPGCNGGADVAAQDHAHSLLQVHNTGVNKANYHNSGSGAGLDHRGDSQAQKTAPPNGGAHFCQDSLQLTAGSLLQGFAHYIHAKQEQGKAA